MLTSRHLDPRLVFIGDSITHFWELNGKTVWDDEYARHPSANLGIAGDRTQHVLWRLQYALDGILPELVIILIGTNNLTADSQMKLPPDSVEEIVEGILAVVGSVRKELPDTHILLLGILPRGDLDPTSTAKIPAINSMLERSYLDDRTVFRDIGANFLDSSGTVSRELMWDRLHLSTEGYKRWADAIRTDVDKVLQP